MDRRVLLKLLASGTALTAAPATLLAQMKGETSPAPAGQPSATDMPPLQGSGIETESAQAVYSLPRDHAWHGGDFYQTNDFNEWHYITVLGRDLDTGERISVFWVPLSQGWVAKEGRPLHNVLFAFHNLDTGEFHTALLYITGPMTTEGSAPGADDFHFRYEIDDGKSAFTTAYTHANETWEFGGYTTEKDDWNEPFRLSMSSQAKAPGYVPMAYWGLESIGVDPQHRQNPETMFGLSYYYTAPDMASSGELEVAGRTVRFEGTGWFEHQWGNFRNTYQYRYFWAWFRFEESGDLLTFRQYYEGEDFRNPNYNVNRYLYMDGETYERSYAFGPAFKLIPERMWTSEKSGVVYPWYGRIETPQGTYWYE
ncbi:MAG: carotenoid 1,2-hydratase, partial [Thioalkalivibrio sp.]|nr:carotenoid 1,2-hydratase [Thioalkalivibrio sp.]